jgi:hypothetical protein
MELATTIAWQKIEPSMQRGTRSALTSFTYLKDSMQFEVALNHEITMYVKVLVFLLFHAHWITSAVILVL